MGQLVVEAYTTVVYLVTENKLLCSSDMLVREVTCESSSARNLLGCTVVQTTLLAATGVLACCRLIKEICCEKSPILPGNASNEVEVHDAAHCAREPLGAALATARSHSYPC